MPVDTPRIIGVGASAGGIEAFRELLTHLKALPPHTAIVFITHLPASHDSKLAEVFATATSMPVVHVSTRTEVEAGRVYVGTTHGNLTVADGYLTVVPRAGETHLRRPIDLFFESLAEDQRHRAVAVLLSGAGDDGMLGLHAVQNVQGRTYAQSPETSKHGDMVRHAMEEGFVDRVLSIDALASELCTDTTSAAPDHPPPEVSGQPFDDDNGAVRDILTQIHQHCGTDFALYRRASVLRRIEHAQHKAGQTSLASYAQWLRSNSEAVSSLFETMLIHVTSFFRDPLAFDALKQKIFPALFHGRDPSMPVRIWVPGCSTGEEAYSVAIAYYEYAHEHGHTAPLKLFATDLSEAVIATARVGRYASGAISALDAGLVQKYFSGAFGQRQVSERLRSSCIFSRHHVVDDPPFSNVDLITCRNLLIYMENRAQQRALSAFYYSLRDPGFLLLGRSESAVSVANMFVELDRGAKAYRRIMTQKQPGRRFAFSADTAFRLLPPKLSPASHTEAGLKDVINTNTLRLLDPISLVMDENFKIIDMRGDVGRILAPVAGRPSLTLPRMAPSRLVSAIRKLMHRANSESAAVRQQHVAFARGGERCRVDLDVVAIFEREETSSPLYLVLFSSLAVSVPVKRARRRQGELLETAKMIERLEGELEESLEHVRALTDDYQRASEALNTLNEDLLSGNEELQSLNEELETAKEELESSNEELSTLNEELQQRNTMLGAVNGDLLNIMAAIDVPLIIVDHQRCIRRFTAESAKFIHCIPSDNGRLVDDLHIKFERSTLIADIQRVIERGGLVEFEISMPDSEWYRVQIRPYLGSTDQTEGAVLSFVDITALKKLITEVEKARDWARDIIEAVPQPLAVLSPEFIIVEVNKAFIETLGTARGRVIGRSIFEATDKLGQSQDLRALLHRIVQIQHGTVHAEIQVETERGMTKSFVTVARAIADCAGTTAIVVGLEDITEQRAAERHNIALETERQSRKKAEEASRAKDDFLAMLSHELRTPLAAISLRTQLMLNNQQLPEQLKQGLQLVETAANTQNALIEDLLDVSRIVAGKMRLHCEMVDLRDVVHAGVEAIRSQAQTKGVELICEPASDEFRVWGDAVRLQQIVGNLLNNAVKFTPSGGYCSVRIRKLLSSVIVEVTDSGLGLEPELQDKIFERFTQRDTSSSRQYGGLGLGLPIVRHLAELHHGTAEVYSDGPNQGSTFRITLPSAKFEPPTAQILQSAPSTSAISQVNLRDQHVLIIDDDVFLRESIRETLIQAGMRVKAAASAKEGLAMLDHFLPQVILCDINMPGDDGYTFVKKLRQRDRLVCQDVPVVAITALASSRDKRLIAESGFVLRLVKPFNITSLLDVVRGAIARREGRA